MTLVVDGERTFVTITDDRRKVPHEEYEFKEWFARESWKAFMRAVGRIEARKRKAEAAVEATDSVRRTAPADSSSAPMGPRQGIGTTHGEAP